MKELSERELKRIADGLISIADQFYTETAGNLYDNPIEELQGMKDEIRSLPRNLIPVIKNAIKAKEQNQ